MATHIASHDSVSTDSEAIRIAQRDAERCIEALVKAFGSKFEVRMNGNVAEIWNSYSRIPNDDAVMFAVFARGFFASAHLWER